jgi:hypothetical protein
VTASNKQPSLAHTPADTGMAFVPVQHLSPAHAITLSKIE